MDRVLPHMQNGGLDRLLSSLKKDGHAVVSVGAYNRCRSLIDRLGDTIQRVAVLVNPNKKGNLFSANEMPLHTDHPRVDIIAWYCRSQSDRGGTSVLADFQSIKHRLDRNTIDDLGKIELKAPPLSRGECAIVEPLISDRGLYFAPWLLTPSSAQEYRASLDAFELALKESPKIRIKLKRGDLLVINNKRILHGRDNIVENQCTRKLVRHWIVAKDTVAQHVG